MVPFHIFYRVRRFCARLPHHGVNMARRDYKQFAIGEIHHAFNRGNNKAPIFLDDSDYRFMLSRLEEALYPGRAVKGALSQRNQRKPLPPDSFDLIAYCLMPNHFHLLIRQKSEISISVLMLKVITSYSKYFNKKYQRVGSLFQDQYKTTHIHDNTQLLHTSAYIHNNPRVDGLVESAEEYPFSSMHEYVSRADASQIISNPNSVLEQFGGVFQYRDFVQESLEVTLRNKQAATAHLL